MGATKLEPAGCCHWQLHVVVNKRKEWKTWRVLIHNSWVNLKSLSSHQALLLGSCDPLAFKPKVPSTIPPYSTTLCKCLIAPALEWVLFKSQDLLTTWMSSGVTITLGSWGFYRLHPIQTISLYACNFLFSPYRRHKLLYWIPSKNCSPVWLLSYLYGELAHVKALPHSLHCWNFIFVWINFVIWSNCKEESILTYLFVYIHGIPLW